MIGFFCDTLLLFERSSKAFFSFLLFRVALVFFHRTKKSLPKREKNTQDNYLREGDKPLKGPH